MAERHVLILCGILLLVLLGFGYVKANEGKDVSGIIFFKTQKLKQLKSFYLDQVGCSLWLDQGGCQIYQAGNMLFGFCQGGEADLQGTITFFYKDKKAVDKKYQQFKNNADGAPKVNKKYNIYHFFARDPEGRTIEFQYFMHPLKIPWQKK